MNTDANSNMNNKANLITHMRRSVIGIVSFATLFYGGVAIGSDPCSLKSTVAEVQYPERVFTNETGNIVADFGKDAFGWLEISAPAAGLEYFINIGEILWNANGIVDRNPGVNVRARGVKWHTEKVGFQRVPVAPDLRNEFDAGEGRTIKLPKKYGVVTPFRAVEFYHAEFPVDISTVRRYVISYPADRNESYFVCDDKKLTKVYDFCKYSMFATSFAGIPVDGDRERIPYEADTYTAQMNWYAISSDYAYPRAGIEYLYENPTWPTEFKQISILSAWADWMWTGDLRSIVKYYEILKKRLMLDHVREKDGLLVSGGERMPWPCYTNRLGLADIVDWPKTERQDFDFRDVNAVVNAFHIRTLESMRDIANALAKSEEAENFAIRAAKARSSFVKVFIDPMTKLVLDGDGSKHSSIQANAIALAFGLLPAEDEKSVAEWLAKQGMGCSVYFAQYLLEALIKTGYVDEALNLITANTDRSWLGMMERGATITTEAWNLRVKPNMDYNHAWGASAISVISRFILGVQPSEPGFKRILIAPKPGYIKRISAVVPTQAGSVRIEIDGDRLSVATPSPSTVIWSGRKTELSGNGIITNIN